MAALRYGDYVAKISAARRSANVRALTGRPVRRQAGESALRVLVADFFENDSYSHARRRYADDVLAFNPWHALEAHRPPGSVMRSRRHACPRSSDFRHAFNGVGHHEPSTIDELPA